eukprot:gene12470-6220_t
MELDDLKLVINIPMTVIFLIILLIMIAYLIRLLFIGTRFQSETNFYAVILLYSSGREAYFILLTISKLTSQKKLYMISHIAYDWGSTFFYTAFLIFTIYWAESRLTSSGRSKNATLSALSFSKILMYIFIIFIQTIQFTLTVIRLLTAKPNEPIDIIDGIQLIFHAILCWIVVLLFILFSLYSSKQAWSFEVNTKAILRAQMMFVVATICSIIIFFKGIFNLILAILEFSEVFNENNEWVMVIINACGAIFLDLIPTFLVILTTFRFFQPKKSTGELIFQEQNVPHYNSEIQNEVYLEISDSTEYLE